MEFSNRIVDAFAYAHDLHKTQVRKGSHVPYITHLLGAASLVGEHGGSEDQFIAALLHDAAEDQGGQATLDTIRERFGEDVANYVEACSDSVESPKPPWFERKQRYIARLAAKPADFKLIVAADKLHNARSIVSDLHAIGNEVWKRFRAGRDDTLWYYREVLDALGNEWRHPILHDLAAAVDAMHREATRLESEA